MSMYKKNYRKILFFMKIILNRVLSDKKKSYRKSEVRKEVLVYRLLFSKVLDMKKLWCI